VRQGHATSWKNIAGLVSLCILYVLIVLYAVFSQSVQSTVAVLCMVLSVIFNIAAPARLASKSQEDRPYDWSKVLTYPIDKFIWGAFLLANLGFFVAKLILYYTNQAQGWGLPGQEMMEVQSALWVYLPLVLLPFAAGALLFVPRSRMLKEYK
jgi:hypothetical protein